MHPDAWQHSNLSRAQAAPRHDRTSSGQRITRAVQIRIFRLGRVVADIHAVADDGRDFGQAARELKCPYVDRRAGEVVSVFQRQ